MLKKAVFIDRDDTIVIDVPYCNTPKDLKLFKGVGNSIKKLNEAGYLVIIITNQSGIARGYFTQKTLEKIHEKLINELKKMVPKLMQFIIVRIILMRIVIVENQT